MQETDTLIDTKQSTGPVISLPPPPHTHPKMPNIKVITLIGCDKTLISLLVHMVSEATRSSFRVTNLSFQNFPGGACPRPSWFGHVTACDNFSLLRNPVLIPNRVYHVCYYSYGIFACVYTLLINFCILPPILIFSILGPQHKNCWSQYFESCF